MSLEGEPHFVLRTQRAKEGVYHKEKEDSRGVSTVLRNGEIDCSVNCPPIILTVRIRKEKVPLYPRFPQVRCD
jgi:hypothetical protein